MSSMEKDNNTGVQPKSSASMELSAANASRRRFGKTGLAASGVLATLASGPVLGYGKVCKSPSGFLSGNLSTHGQPPLCEGRSPGYWKNHGGWPVANRSTCKFSSVFTCKKGSPYASITMLKLLSHQNFDKQNLGMHLVAAYLNALKGWTPFLSIETIKAMFSEWQAGGYFSPTAGVKWDAGQIVDYLQRTQG